MENQVFLIVEATPNPHNKEDMQIYGSQAPVLMKKHGGIPVARYTVESIIGSGEKPAAIAVISFPNREAIQNLLVNDPEYQQLIPNRDKAFTSIRFLVCNEQIQ